ncbi:MAG: hypothetical protein CMM01_23300 [Rhodopirellula sp.]|nr:hypothetical protein [Rhodopirellula sp.]
MSSVDTAQGEEKAAVKTAERARRDADGWNSTCHARRLKVEACFPPRRRFFNLQALIAKTTVETLDETLWPRLPV